MIFSDHFETAPFCGEETERSVPIFPRERNIPRKCNHQNTSFEKINVHQQVSAAKHGRSSCPPLREARRHYANHSHV